MPDQSLTGPVNAIRRQVERGLRFCCALLIGVLAALVFLQVVFRFVFRSPFDWAEELARYAFIWVSVLGAVLGVEAKAHFYVDVFPSMLSPQKRRVLDRLLRAIVFVFLLVVAVASVKLTWVMGSQSSPVLDLPLSYTAISLPIGFFGMCAFLLCSGLFVDSEREPGTD